MKLRITIIIPLVLIAASLVTSFILFQQNMSAAGLTIRADAKEQLQLDITRLQNILYNLLTENKIAEARVNVSVMAMDSSIRSLILTDEKHAVLVANRYIWEKSLAREVSGYDQSIALIVKENNQPEIFYDKDNPNLLKGYYPVILKLENDKGIPNKRIGILFSESSIESKLNFARSHAVDQSLLFAGIMSMTSILVAILLHFLISRRLNLLTKAARQLAMGDLDVKSNIAGDDEISLLGASFDEMVKQLNISAEQTKAAEQELTEFNDSLEQLIAERTQLLHEAQRIAKIGNWVWDVKKNSISWSIETFRIFELSSKDFQPDVDKFLSLVHPDDKHNVQQALQSSINNKESYSIEHRMIMPDGTSKWVREKAIPEFDADGEIIKLVGIIQDINTQKLERENRQKLEKQLQQAQKMESLGQLTGGIAHDFNNMLASISGFTELAMRLEVKDPSGKLSSYLEQVSKSSKKAADLVSQMLAFSRKGESFAESEVLDVPDLVSDLLAMLRPILPSSININVLAASHTYKILGNPVMLNQVLMNLCVNAKDAMDEDQGKIEISVAGVNVQNHVCSSCHHSFSGQYIEIKVKDNGSGMSHDVLDNLFEPFYTTKPVGKGTGMGLPMVHGIVHKHGGHIIVKSQLGEGSDFRLLFPIVEADKLSALDKKGIDQDAERIQNNNQRHILIIDDEISITMFMKELLQQYGYQTTTINRSEDALKYFHAHSDEIDLVITDYTMPKLNGVQLATSILESNKDIPIYLCTGYSEHIDEEKARQLNIKAFITKPIEIDKLLKQLEKDLS